MIYSENRPFPPDIRIEKEISSLCSAGHQISVLAPRVPKNAPLEEALGPHQAVVRRATVTESNFVERLSQVFLLQYPNWIEHLKDFIKRYSPDLLHVHDLYLLPTTIRAGRHYGLPVIADLHENIPAARRAYRSAQKPLPRLISAITYNYHLWRWHEARALQQCAAIIVVVPEAAERLYKYGIAKKKVIVVSNTEDETTFQTDPKKVDPVILQKFSSTWVASYIGGIGPHRGLDTTIQALPAARDRIPNLKLVIIGADSNEKLQILKMCRNSGVTDVVEIIDWQPFEKVASYIYASDVCLVPHKDFEHTQTTVPHKLFQYMICKKPVLVSNCQPLARIVEDTQSGIVFQADNSDDLAQKLIMLYQNPEKVAEMGKNGYQAAVGPYAWRHDAKRLIHMYQRLENKNR